jgi:hypothetical protein
MRSSTFVFLSLLLFSALTPAQTSNGNVFFGYSFYNTDLSSIDRANANGWEASVEGKINPVIPFLGFVADFDAHYGSENFPCTQYFAFGCPVSPGVPVGFPPAVVAYSNSFTEYNFLFGPRVAVPAGKFRPFAQALFGGTHVTLNHDVGSDSAFATAIGGGLDYRLIRRIAWRFQGDYVQTRLFGTTQNNVRISTGIVLRF